MAISLTGLLGSIGSIASNFYNTAQSSRNADLAYNRQRSLMAMQQGYAVQNWNREVNYNSPIEQMKRLKEGDLNPNLVYGNGAVGLEAPSTAAPTAPSAPMAPVVPMSNPIAEAAQAAQALSMAKKAGSETIGQDIENTYQYETLMQRIEKAGLDNKWTREQTNKVMQEYSKLVGECNALQKTVESLDEDIKAKKITNEQLRDRIQAEINKIRSESAYNDAIKGLTDSEKKLFDDNMQNLLDISKNQADFLGQTVNLLSKYGDAQAIVGMLTSVVSSISDVVGAFNKIQIKK